MTTLISTRPATLDFDLYAGDSFAVEFQFKDQVTGDPWPLTGTWKAEIRNAGGVVTEFIVDDTNQATGSIKLGLTGAQTAELGALPGCHHQSKAPACSNCLVWDLEQMFDGGPRTWYRGSVHVASDVTRP